MMIKYEPIFSILKYDGSSRLLRIGVLIEGTSSITAHGINGCTYDYSSDIVEKLLKIVEQGYGEHEWGGGERSTFVSGPNITRVIDNFQWEKDTFIQSEEIIKLLIIRMELIKSWTDSKISGLVRDSFLRVKNNRHLYAKKPHEYLIKNKKNTVLVSLILLEDDFKLSPVDFIKQVQITW